MFYRRYGKRIMDITCSIIAIILLSPVLLIVAIMVKTKLGSPVLFKQNRPGLNEEIFTMMKFRTMTDERDEKGELLSDSIRLTRFGRFLRSTSLDELPELFNILKGEMSIIGPRPLVIKYLPYYNAIEKNRHNVRPGLSGLAQTNGRNTVNWDMRFKYDVEYVNKYNFFMDTKIIILTVLKVFRKENIGERGIDAPIDFDIYRKRLEGNKNESC